MKKLAVVCFLLFAISAFSQSQTITVTSPNGGENWVLGSTHAITWRPSGMTGKVNILLFNGEQRVGVIQSDVPVAAGSFSWVVGNYQGGTAAPGTNYKIRIRKPQTEIMDSSDRSFTISAAAGPTASLTVMSPNGGETWLLKVQQPNTATVTWTAQYISGDIRIILKKGGNPVRDQIVLNIGSCTFPYAGLAEGDDYKIRVESEDQSVSDESDRNFSIKKETLLAAESKLVYSRGPRITSFKINNGAELTNSLTVTLNNAATGSPTHYRVEKRRTRTLYWTEWLPYSTEPTTDLFGSCGEISVRLQVKNDLGASEPAADSIIYSFDQEQTMPAGCLIACPCRIRVASGWTYRRVEGVSEKETVPFLCTNPDSDGNYQTVEIVVSALPLGNKKVFEFFAGRQLNEGWSFVKINYRGTEGTYNIRRMPQVGGRDIRFEVSVFSRAGGPNVHFYVDGVVVRGPCHKNVDEAFN